MKVRLEGSQGTEFRQILKWVEFTKMNKNIKTN